jgi:anti-sigma B factor antagonist
MWSPSHPCGMQAHDLGDCTVVRFTGGRVMLDEENAAAVGEHLLVLVEGLQAGRLLLDFGNVTYLSSSALGLLLRLRKALHARGGRLTLCHLAPQVYEVFEVTKLHTLFDIRQGEGAADRAGSTGPAMPPRSPDAPGPWPSSTDSPL